VVRRRGQAFISPGARGQVHDSDLLFLPVQLRRCPLNRFAGNTGLTGHVHRGAASVKRG
jgi:hypothetical protein